MKKIVLAAATALIATTAAVSAHSVDRVQERQAERIEHGRESGKITWSEGLKLRAEQRRINKVKDKLAADGYLSRRDRKKVHNLQREANKHIAHEKRDGWRRVWWLPRFGY